MNSRERVRATCRFEEPDRVPIDLGGSAGASGIHVGAYAPLRKHLGLPFSGSVQCDDVMQLLALVEADVRERFHTDVASISATSVVQDWETHPLFKGLNVCLPAGLDMTRERDGTWLLKHPDGKRYLKPPASPYFDSENGMGWYSLGPALTDETLAALQTYGRTLYDETDLALCARFGGGFSSHQPQFLFWNRR